MRRPSFFRDGSCGLVHWRTSRQAPSRHRPSPRCGHPSFLGHLNGGGLATLSALDKMSSKCLRLQGSKPAFGAHASACERGPLASQDECRTFVLLAGADPFASSRTTVISVLHYPSKSQRGRPMCPASTSGTLAETNGKPQIGSSCPPVDHHTPRVLPPPTTKRCPR